MPDNNPSITAKDYARALLRRLEQEANARKDLVFERQTVHHPHGGFSVPNVLIGRWRNGSIELFDDATRKKEERKLARKLEYIRNPKPPQNMFKRLSKIWHLFGTYCQRNP